MFTLEKDFSFLRLVVLALLILGCGTYAYSQSIDAVGTRSTTTIPLKNAVFQDSTSLGGIIRFRVTSRAVADGIDTVAVVLPISREKFFPATLVTATRPDPALASSRYDSISVGGGSFGTTSAAGYANATGDTLFIFLKRTGAVARTDTINLIFKVTPNTVNISNNSTTNFTYITLVDTVKYALFIHGGSILKNTAAGPGITLTPGPTYQLNWARGRAPQNGAAVMATAAIDATADTLYLLDFNNNITSDITTVVSLDALIASTGNPGSGIFYGSTLAKPTGGGKYVYTNLKYSIAGTFKARASATGVLSNVAAATFIVTAGIPKTVSVSLSKTSIDVNTTTDLTVTAVDTFYNAVSNNARVKFTETLGGGGGYLEKTGITAVSGQNSPVYIGYFPSTGTGTVTYTPSKNYTGTVTTKIEVQADNTAGSAVVCSTTPSITVTAGGEALITSTPHDTSVAIGGTTSTFRVIVKDSYGNTVTSGLSAGDITATAQKGTVGTITLSGVTFLVPYTPFTTRGMDTITYKLGATQYTTISSVGVNSGPPATVTIYETAGDSTIIDSKATRSVTLQAMAKDAYGNNVNGSLYKLRFTILTSGPSGSWKSGSRGASAIKDTVTAVIADSIVSMAFYSDTLAQAAVQVGALYPTTSNFASATIKASLNLKIKLDTVSMIANKVSILAAPPSGSGVTITSRLTDIGGNNIAVSDTGSIRYVLVKGRGTLDATTRKTTTDGAVQIVYTTYATAVDTATITTTARNNPAINNTVTIISVPSGPINYFTVTINTADASKIAGDSVNITITAMDLLNRRIYAYNAAGQTVTLNNTTVSPVVTKDTTYYFSYTDKNGKYVKRSNGIALTDSIFVQGLASITLHKFTAEATSNTVTITDTNAITGTSANGSIFKPGSCAGQTTWSVTLKDTVGLNTPFNYTITPRDKYYNINSTVLNFGYVSSNQGTNFDAGSNPMIFTGPVTYNASQSVATNNLIIYVSDGTSTLLGQSKAIVAKAGVTGVEQNNSLPTAYSLLQNYPNPFNPSTTIQFGLPVSSPVTMEIYNVLGVKVRTLIHGEVMNAAMHQVVWNGKDDAGISVASGVYLYRINAGTFQVSKKMMMLK